MKKILLSFVVFLLISSSVFSQDRIGGFVEDRFIEDGTYSQSIQFDKLTDVYIAFASPDASKNSVKWRFAEMNIKRFVGTAHKVNVRAHMSIGGAAVGNTGWTTIISTSTKRKAFAKNVAHIVKTFRFDGINLDWEFPAGQYATNFATLATEIRAELDLIEIETGKTLELSAAVAPLQWNNAGINSTFISKMDYILVMAFDDGNCGSCGGPNHSSLTHATNATNYWIDTKGANANQIIIAIPFYSNSKTHYNSFSTSNPSAYYNDADGAYGGQLYNSRPLIEAKIDMITDKGGAGVFAWELTQDRTDQYSLLGAIADKLGDALNCPGSSLGGDITLCDQPLLVLDAAVNKPGVTYKWYKNNQLLSGEMAETYTTSKSGTYKVVRTLVGCTDKESEMTLTSNILDIDHQVVCKNSTATIIVNNPSGTIEWFTTKTGGTAIATGDSYTTPALLNTVNYYVSTQAVATGGSCTGTDDWDASVSYWGQALVVYQNKKYKAGWWTQGDVPTAGGVWTYQEDCGSTSCARAEVILTVEVCDGIYDAEDNIALNIFPTLTSDNIKLEFIDGSIIDAVQVIALDGSVVAKYTVAESKFTLPMSSLQANMYLLRITSGINTYVKTVVKQ